MENLCENKKKPLLLIAESNRKNRELMARFLMEKNYNVLITGNGRQLLSRVKKETPDLILLDINLPDFSGIEICRKLKSSELTEAIPVIFMIKKREHKLIIKIFESGGADYFIKPLPRIELERKIKNFC